MLDVLVDEGKDNRVSGSLDRQARAGREGEEDPRGEDEKECSSCQKVPHLFVVLWENLPRSSGEL